MPNSLIELSPWMWGWLEFNLNWLEEFVPNCTTPDSSKSPQKQAKRRFSLYHQKCFSSNFQTSAQKNPGPKTTTTTTTATITTTTTTTANSGCCHQGTAEILPHLPPPSVPGLVHGPEFRQGAGDLWHCGTWWQPSSWRHQCHDFLGRFQN